METRDETSSSEPTVRGASRPPTIEDVAALSGVSKSTVSNVTRGVIKVSPETRDRVLEAISTLGYRPNAVARNLVQQRTNLVGVIVGNLANAFAAELVKRISQQTFERGYPTLLGNTDGDPNWEASLIEALLQQRVDGLVMVQFSGDRDVLSQLLRERTPVVMTSCWSDYNDSVAVDDYAGIALAVEHLAGLGHRHIAMVGDGTIETSTAHARRDALERALLRTGLGAPAGPGVTWDEASGLEARIASMRTVLEGEPPPTALVCANDFTAIRAMEAAELIGRRVPNELSITGFDGIDIGSLARISLTTVAQPRDELARTAIDLLLARMGGDRDAPLQQIRLQPELVVRGSTAAPPSA